MIVAAKYTNQGGRSQNEDACDVFLEADRACAVVADGLGGYGGGEIASALAVEKIKEVFLASKSLTEQALLEQIAELNTQILQEQQPTKPMKTTIAVLSLDKEEALAVHIGDTRIYHFDGGQISKITFDHSVSQMAVLTGEITQEEIRHHVDRNKLLRSLGGADEVKAEVTRFGAMQEGEHAFLLCTDGFWEYVYEEEMEKLLQKAATPDEWLSGMIKRLQKRAPDNCDNYTAVAVWNKK